MNVQKYPPSLLFMSVTIAGGLFFITLAKNTETRVAKVLSVYGRVPLFYFIVHFYVLHIFSGVVYLLRGHTLAEGTKGLPGFPLKFVVPGEGYSLTIVYVIWITVVIALYLLCKWYDTYKAKNKQKWWLSYL